MFNADTLYDLLPRFYRLKEGGDNEALRALFDVMAREIGVVESDIQRLYDNAFIETCDPWAIPYIGDLLGVEVQHDLSTADFNTRARVANTIAHRRRKGTLSMLARFAADSSGWRVHAVEFMHRLATTQHLNHLRPRAVYTAPVNQMAAEAAGEAFDPWPRSVDVRNIEERRAAVPNIMNVGLFLWRIEAFALEGVRAMPVSTAASGETSDGKYYHLDPLGRQVPLFNLYRSRPVIEAEARMPTPLRRSPLASELAAMKNGGPAGPYFADKPVVTIVLDGEPLSATEIAICDLGDWAPPPAGSRASLDPVRGRLALQPGDGTARVHSAHAYGFSDAIGAGPLGRESAAEAFVTGGEGLDWLLEVNQSRPPVTGHRVDSLVAAIDNWNQQPAGTRGVILISDSDSYSQDLSPHPVKLPGGSRLLMVAGDTPPAIDPANPAAARPWSAARTRPCIVGDLRIEGETGEDDGGALALNGLLVGGEIDLVGGRLQALEIDHCTVTGEPGGRLKLASGVDCRRIEIRASRLKGLALGAGGIRVTISDSLLEGEAVSIVATRSDLTLNRATVMGATQCRTVSADACIFMQPLHAERTQSGCVRYSYLPPESRSPRPHRCQPQLALQMVPVQARRQTLLRLRPTFTSLEPAHFAYGQLGRACAEEIRTGAENGAEMGAFNRLLQPQREANIRAGLKNYLRWGLNAGLIPVT